MNWAKKQFQKKSVYDFPTVDACAHHNPPAVNAAAHSEKDRHGAHTAHKSADAERVRKRLAQAVYFRDRDSANGAGLVSARLNHANGVIRTADPALPCAGV